jgi:ATP-dependent helicase Lhr and Lhr-like helicase
MIIANPSHGLPLGSRRNVLETFFGSFQRLRPIQRNAYGPILLGGNIIICSGTGSGKTEAAIAPLIDRLYADLHAEAGIVIVYLCPTKALINDLRQRLAPKCLALGISIAIRHGDQPNEVDLAKAALLITTPESLDVLLCRADGLLSRIRAVIIDEAHLFFNNQRGLQLGMLLHRISRRVAQPLQLVAMSATVSDPTELTKFLFANVSPDGFQVLRDENGKSLDPYLRILERPQDVAPLVDMLLAQPRKLLLFANSRRECDVLASVLRDGTGFRDSIYVHHSSLAAATREQVESEFASKRRAVCVATSTLELGIDIGDIDAVLLYGAAQSYESFLQRIGRGSRRSSKTTLVCMVPPTQRSLLHALIHMATLNRLQRSLLPVERSFTLFGAAVQQILSYLHERDGSFVRSADFMAALGPSEHLGAPTIDLILAHLASERVLKRHGFKYSYGADEGFHRLRALRLLHGNYPGSARSVAVCEKSREIGRMHVVNLLRLSPGTRFRFAGKIFEVASVTHEVVEVRPSRGHGLVIDLSYPGGAPSVHPALLHDVLEFMAGGTLERDLMTPKDADWLEERIARLRPLVQGGGTPFIRTQTGIAHLTFAGTLFNRTIAVSTGAPAESSDDLWLVTKDLIRSSDVRSYEEYQTFLPQVVDATEKPTLFQALLPPELRLAELSEAWFKTATHRESLARLSTANTRPADPMVVTGLV